MINGLINRIAFYLDEKEKNDKIKKKEIFNFRTDRKKRTERTYLDDYKRKRINTLVIRDDNLIELNVKNILRNSKNINNMKLDFILDNYTSRERIKTISKKKKN